MKYLNILKIIIKANIQYKFNFFIGILNQFFVIFFEFLGVLSLFNKFGSLNNWKLTETFLLYGIINFSFSFSEVFFRGFESNLQYLIREGKYDRYLLRPYSTLLQISGFNFQPVRLGRLILSIFVLMLGIIFNFRKLKNPFCFFYLIIILICAVFLYGGIYILVGSLTFLLGQYVEFTSIFIQGSVSMLQYPKNVFPKSIQVFFTYILPVTLVTYYPVSILLGKLDEKNIYFKGISVLVGILVFFISYKVFRFLEKRYSSTGN